MAPHPPFFISRSRSSVRATWSPLAIMLCDGRCYYLGFKNMEAMNCGDSRDFPTIIPRPSHGFTSMYKVESWKLWSSSPNVFQSTRETRFLDRQESAWSDAQLQSTAGNSKVGPPYAYFVRRPWNSSLNIFEIKKHNPPSAVPYGPTTAHETYWHAASTQK